MGMSDAEVHECTKPPLVVDNLDAGIIYFAAVALQDANGYLSLWSQLIRVEKPIGKRILFFMPFLFILWQCMRMQLQNE